MDISNLSIAQHKYSQCPNMALLTSETPAIAPAANWYAKGRGFSGDDMVGCVDCGELSEVAMAV